MALVRERVVDSSVLALGEQGLKAGVAQALKGWPPTERGTSQAVGLPLPPTRTRIRHAPDAGFDFLGWHFRGGQKWPRKKRPQKLRERLRPRTRRPHRRSLGEISAAVNAMRRGWHGCCQDRLRSGLSGPDGWLRRRLRTLLRQREKRPGAG